MTDLSSLQCFQAVYQCLSMSKAAKKLGLSKASVSKRILSLEADLGGELFLRTTRQMVPTKEADRLIQKVEALLGALDEIENLFDEQKELKGKIRVTAGHSMATKFFGDLLLDFQDKYPGIEIDFLVTDNILDPIENDIDISLRVNPSEISSLIGKKIGPYQLKLVANADYLKKKPVKKLEDLKKHQFFAMNAHLMAQFEESEKRISSFIEKNRFSCSDSAVIGKFIRDGKGIGIRSNWDIKEEVEKGTLKEILPSLKIKQGGEVWLLSHPSKLKNQRVSILFYYLEERLRNFF